MSGTSMDGIDVAAAEFSGAGTDRLRARPARGRNQAYLMALIGYLDWHGTPATGDALTGARRPRVLGRLGPGDGPLCRPEPCRPPRTLIVTR